ncbi:MAG: hypothetical protein ACKN9T_18150 [Candidatus Methylumidiphilus sp.]
MDTWAFDDQIWRRTDNDGFAPSVFREMDAEGQVHSPRELAALVGAHCWREAAGEALYPGPFRHSPVSGQPLPAIPAPVRQTWLPPFGDSPALHCLGLRQTALSLSLPPGLRPEDEPGGQLPLPPPGEYQFMVGNFKTCTPLLLALNPGKGQLYLYIRQTWAELQNRSKHLPESSLPFWGLALDAENRLLLPTDEGLAVLDLNVLTLSYTLRLLPGRCLGAPAVLGEFIVAPAVDDDGHAGLLQVARATLEWQWLDCAPVGAGGAFNVPLVEKRQAYWLNVLGQIRLRLNADNLPVPTYIPWNAGTAPRFEFGSPYAKNGQIWQICYDETLGQYQYVQLGREQPEKHPCSAPRLTAGAACFAQETQLAGPPWSEPEVAYGGQSNDVVIPLLEAANEAALCVRVDWVKGLDALFASATPHLARFELIGRNGSVAFFTQKLPKPWLAQPFVHDGWLYLYHPDLKMIPGWKLA